MPRTLILLWVVVLLEMLSPIPLFLTIGAAWVLLVRPPWFRRVVLELYDSYPPTSRGS